MVQISKKTKTKKYITDFNISTSPASKTTRQGRRIWFWPYL